MMYGPDACETGTATAITNNTVQNVRSIGLILAPQDFSVDWAIADGGCSAHDSLPHGISSMGVL